MHQAAESEGDEGICQVIRICACRKGARDLSVVGRQFSAIRTVTTDIIWPDCTHCDKTRIHVPQLRDFESALHSVGLERTDGDGLSDF